MIVKIRYSAILFCLAVLCAMRLSGCGGEEEKAEEEKKAEHATSKEDLVTVTASSIQELLKKIEEITYSTKSDFVQTEQEKAVGQHIDFRG